MKKKVLPDSQQKRKLIFDKKIPRDRIISYGEMYLREGRLYEAAELFARASHGEGMDQLKSLAVEQGDSFLYDVACRGSAEEATPEAWKTLGKKAMELNKYTHAARAFRKAGNEELLKAAAEALREVVSVDKA